MMFPYAEKDVAIEEAVQCGLDPNECLLISYKEETDTDRIVGVLRRRDL